MFLTQVHGANIPSEELEAEVEMTNRQCRQAELLRQHSSRADLVVVTLPLPKYHPELFYLLSKITIFSMEGYQQVGPSTVPGWTF